MAQRDTNFTQVDSEKGYKVNDVRQSDTQFTYEAFADNPVTAGIGGGAATGTAGDENALLTPYNAFEYHILGTQTITAPSKNADGLNIGMDQTNNDGVELSQGILSNSKHAFTIGTDDAFFLSVTIKIPDVSGTDDCAIGFRKAEAYQAAIDNYDEMAALNVISGNINIETILNNGATDTTDTTDDFADGEEHTLTVIVRSDGAVDFEIDGAVPSTTASFTFDDGEVVVPFLYFLHASDVAGAVAISKWECGYLADRES